MSEQVELVPAIEAAAAALWAETFADEACPPDLASADQEDRERCTAVATATVQAAATHIERAVREHVAQKIDAFREGLLENGYTDDEVLQLLDAAAIARGTLATA